MTRNKDSWSVLAPLFRKYFRDKDVVEIIHGQHVNDGKEVEVYARKDGLDLYIKMTKSEYVELMLEGDRIQVLTPAMKKEKGIEDDLPPRLIEQPKAPQALSKEVVPTKEELEFVPPTQVVATTRCKIGMNDTRGKSTWKKFEAFAPVPPVGKSRLTSEQREVWDRTKEIAKSYLLAEDYVTINKWIAHLERLKKA